MAWIDEVHEEADNHIVVHIKDMLEKGITFTTVRTVDLDVIVIILGFMTELKEV